MSVRMHLMTPATASLLLRIGLAVEFLVFGYGKLADTASWIGFIPPWMSPLIPIAPEQFLHTIGVIEIVLGALLVLGLWTRVVAVLAVFHLLGVLVALGYNELAVRDFVSFTAAAALVALGPAGCRYALDGNRHSSL